MPAFVLDKLTPKLTVLDAGLYLDTFKHTPIFHQRIDLGKTQDCRLRNIVAADHRIPCLKSLGLDVRSRESSMTGKVKACRAWALCRVVEISHFHPKLVKVFSIDPFEHPEYKSVRIVGASLMPEVI
jgi:hypothetical protein